jgi:hypothetical protein
MKLIPSSSSAPSDMRAAGFDDEATVGKRPRGWPVPTPLPPGLRPASMLLAGSFSSPPTIHDASMSLSKHDKSTPLMIQANHYQSNGVI